MSGLILLAGCAGSDPAPTVEVRTATQAVAATVTSTTGVTPTTLTEPTSTATAAATATSTLTPSPAPTSTATATATETATATATATPPPPTATVAEGALVITGVLYDPPVERDADGEQVTILNSSPAAVDMTGWTLSDIAEHVYTFPSFVLQPGASVVVHICNGEDGPENLYWRHCSAIWNNDGDTAYLRDATGRDITSYSY